MARHLDLFTISEMRLKGTYTLELGSVQHSQGLFDVIEREREYLREWLPWVDASKDLRSTIEYAHLSDAQHKKREALQFTICDSGSPIGRIGTHLIDWAHKSTSIGYWISKEHVGQGLVTLAVKELSKALFEKSDLHRLEIRAAVQNVASRKVAIKAGYKEEGLLRDAEFLYDHFVDLIVHSLLRSEARF